MRYWTKALPIVGFIFMSLLVACEDPKEIGGDLLTTDVNTNYTDTFTVKLSTVLLDSNVTSQATYFLVGRYNDPVFGNIESKAYAKILGDVSTGIDSTSIADSVQLRAVYGYYYGDTTRSQTINIHRLTEDLSTTQIYFSSNSVAYEPTPLGSATKKRLVKYRSSAGDTVKFDTLVVNFKGAFAREMLRYAIHPDSMNSNFKGIAFVHQGATNGAVIGLNPSQTQLNVYAHYVRRKTSGVGDTTYINNYSFKPSYLSRSTVRFNQITVNRGASAVAALTRPNMSIPAAKTNNLAYLQTVLGVTTKVEIPYLAKFKAGAGKVAINQAILLLEPQAGTFNELVRTPFSASLARCTPLNQLIKFKVKNTQTADSTSYLLNVSTDYSSDWWYSGYSTNSASSSVYFLPDKKLYAFNLTSFLQSTLVDIANYKKFNGLLLMSSYSGGGFSINNDVNRAVFDANKAKLRVYFTNTPN